MNILIVSWRDLENPHSGGAEIYTHQIFKQLAKRGHQITHLSNRFPGSTSSSTIDGIRYLRIGLDRFPYAFMFFSYYYLVTNFRRLRAHIIINCIHGLPNLTSPYLPLLRQQLSARQSIPTTLYLAFELAGPIWFKQTHFPLNFIGYFAEKLYTKFLHNLPFITISPSQAKLLALSGVTNLTVIPPGINEHPLGRIKSIPKSRQPLFVSLGRLAPMKQLDHTIRAFHLFHRQYPKSKLIIIGRGTPHHLSFLNNLITQFHLQDSISLVGYLDEIHKYQILAKSWALISTSINEGWGLNVIEAASVGTPTLAYRSPGLVDTVQHLDTGLLTPSNYPSEIHKLMTKITRQPRLRSSLSKSALTYASQFTWRRAATQWQKLLNLQSTLTNHSKQLQ